MERPRVSVRSPATVTATRQVARGFVTGIMGSHKRCSTRRSCCRVYSWQVCSSWPGWSTGSAGTPNPVRSRFRRPEPRCAARSRPAPRSGWVPVDRYDNARSRCPIAAPRTGESPRFVLAGSGAWFVVADRPSRRSARRAEMAATNATDRVDPGLDRAHGIAFWLWRYAPAEVAATLGAALAATPA